MDLQFILRQLLEQRDSLDNTIRALEELTREREERASAALTGELRKSPGGLDSLICRWCRKSFVSEHWSPVCASVDCREKEAALKEWRKAGKTRRGR
ncbi:MAG TPA: hypothetical protein VK789_24860 [Bryobacteraceae bacterium]|nr:hypothetical protein [Bryobacteraceae bacterium]